MSHNPSQLPSQPAAASDAREATESSFLASDGQEIFYRVWKPACPSSHAVMLFHRGHEHSGRWQEFVDSSQLNDCWFFAWDARGHGRTEGPRGAAESFARMVRDADEFYQHIVNLYGLPPEDIAVVGQSVGAVLAATWIHDYAPRVRAMVLATPALRIKLYVPLAIPALRWLHKIRPQSFIRSYVRPGMLTHDPEQAKSYADDPLVSPQIAVNILLDLHDASTRLIDDAGAIHTPTLMWVSGRDYVVRQDVQQQFFAGLSSADKQLQVLDDFYHSTFWEKDRGKVIAQSADFLRQRFAQPATSLESNRLAAGSESKYQALQRPASLLKRAWFGLQRMSLNSVGRLSRGVRIGWQSGFDSGQSLDHVYRNRAEGTTLLGRLIDRGYLDSIGWRGIRQRKLHMERLLDEAIAAAIDQFGQVVLMDVAAGPGRYVLETIKRNESLPIRGILCDRDPGGLAEGRQLATELGLLERVEFRQSDAFDPDAIRAAAQQTGDQDPQVHIAIVSGLYELFPDNEWLKRSLAGLASVIVPGGYLLYTDQPWHPQQEMIARVLPNRDGDPWVMRCRSQAEMDALVAEAGLRRQKMFLDNWGIFSVALAKK
jgi:alpha-beta hydrolase superfamily lysophospholipase